jgi:hypothetical protein
VNDLDLKKLIGAALMVPPTDNWHYPLSENQLRYLIDHAVKAEREACAKLYLETEPFAKLVAEHEREACIKIIEAHQIPVGNSPAGEMARDWTVDALKDIRDEICARGESK